MKYLVSTACVLLCILAAVLAAPLFPAQLSASTNLQIGGSGGSTSVSTTPASGGGGLSEVLSSIDIPGLLRSVNSIVKLVGVFCPPLSQVLDNVIQNVTSVAFRVFGRAILRGGLGGGGGATGGSGGGDGGSRVNVVLPTYPPDDDYDDEDESTTSDSSSSTASPANDAENTVAKRHVRVVREAEQEEEEEDDQDGAESAPQPAEDLSEIDVDDADRDKRYTPFGGLLGGGHASGGGSGNFLFDLIRLVAGSGATEESDEKVNAPGGVAEVDIAKGVGSVHGTGEGIPGPITRLFVVANRGLANLVQDLILRLAQTSERIVNFKARLVTSLI